MTLLRIVRCRLFHRGIWGSVGWRQCGTCDFRWRIGVANDGDGY